MGGWRSKCTTLGFKVPRGAAASQQTKLANCAVPACGITTAAAVRTAPAEINTASLDRAPASQILGEVGIVLHSDTGGACIRNKPCVLRRVRLRTVGGFDRFYNSPVRQSNQCT